MFREQVRNKYRELSEKEKNIKREYGRNRYHVSKEKTQRLNILKLEINMKNLFFFT